MNYPINPAVYKRYKRPLRHQSGFLTASAEYDVAGDAFSLSFPLFSLRNALNDFELSADWRDWLAASTPFQSLPAGWKWNFERRLVQNQNNTYTLWDANGKSHEFVRPANPAAPVGVYFDPSGTRLILRVDASARTVEDASRNQFVFDADGFLTKIRVFNGKTHTETAISYSQGKVSSLSLQSDAVLTFSYGASSATVSSSTGESMSLVLSAGRVSSVTDCAGLAFSITYLQSGLPSAVSSGARTLAMSRMSGHQASLVASAGGSEVDRADFVKDGDLFTCVRTPFGASSCSVTRRYVLDESGECACSWEDVAGRIEGAKTAIDEWPDEGEIASSVAPIAEAAGPCTLLPPPDVVNIPLGSLQEITRSFLQMEVRATPPQGETSGFLSYALIAGGHVLASDYLPISGHDPFIPIQKLLTKPNASGPFASVYLQVVGSPNWDIMVRNVRIYPFAGPIVTEASNISNGTSIFAKGDRTLYRLGEVALIVIDYDLGIIQAASAMRAADYFASYEWNEHNTQKILWGGDGATLYYGVACAIATKQLDQITPARVTTTYAYGAQWNNKIQSANIIESSSVGFDFVSIGENYEDRTEERVIKHFNGSLLSMLETPLSERRILYTYDNVFGHLISSTETHCFGTANAATRQGPSYSYSQDGRFCLSVSEPVGGSLALMDTYDHGNPPSSDIASSTHGSLNAVDYSYLSGHRMSSVSSSPLGNSAQFSDYFVTSMASGPCSFSVSYDGAGAVSCISQNGDPLVSNERLFDGSRCVSETAAWANGFSDRVWTDPYGRQVKRHAGKQGGATRLKVFYQDIESPAVTWSSPESNPASESARLARKTYLMPDGVTFANRDYHYRASDGKIDYTTEELRTFQREYGYEDTPYQMSYERLITKNQSGSPVRTETDLTGFGNYATQGRIKRTSLPGATVSEQVRSWSFAEDETSSVVVLNAMEAPTGRYNRTLAFSATTSGKVTRYPSSEDFEYNNGGNSWPSKAITYSWNSNGMLTGVASPSSGGYGFSQSFSYDSYGRLAGETNALGITYSYTYDSRGNVTNKFYEVAGWPVGSLRTYDSKDRLTAMTDFPGANAFSYDASGYPTRYKNKDVSWDGPMMTGYGSASYAYDGLGRLRTVSDSPRSASLKYIEDRLGTIEMAISGSTYVMEMIYGPKGLIGFKLGSDDVYIYHKNILGDIVAIYKNGILQAQYRHDAWGNCLVLNASGVTDTSASFVGNLNPFRYRGAFYDVCSGLYLMGSRPYDSDVGRFICPDDPSYLDVSKLGGLNLYAFEFNNPTGLLEERFTFNAILPEPSNGSQHIFAALRKEPKKENWLFGVEHRSSGGWESNPFFISNSIIQVGLSVYSTHTIGKKTPFYVFSGETVDASNLLGTTKYVGFGFRIGNSFSMEVRYELLGFGIDIHIGHFTLSFETNLFGMTSLTIGWTVEQENGFSQTTAVTFGINTILLLSLGILALLPSTSTAPAPIPAPVPLLV